MTVRTLSQIATFLLATPSSYNSLTTAQKQDFTDTLAPKIAGFDGSQRAWFKDWWLACTQAQVDSINAALPANVRVSPVSYLGQLYLNIDIATDCLQLTDTYGPARPVLRTMVFTNIPNLPDLLPKPTVP